MALLHFDGFDSKTTTLPGAYSYPITRSSMGSYVTGRFGTGSALRGSTGNDQGFSLMHSFGVGVTKTAVATGVFAMNGDSYQPANCYFMDFYSAGNSVLSIRVNSTSNNPAGRMSVHNSGGEIGASSVALLPDAWQRVEVKVKCGLGTSGSVEIRQNGATTLNLPATNTGSTTLSGVGLSFRMPSGGSFGDDGYQPTFDDWWVCSVDPDLTAGTINNDFLGDVRVLGISPTLDGFYKQLTPGAASPTNYTTINEIPPSTNEWVGSTVAGTKDTYAFADIATTYTNIKGVRVGVMAGKSDAGPVSGRVLTRTGSTDTGGPDFGLSSTPMIFSHMMETHPTTAVAWTAAEVNAAQFGWEVR